MVLAEDSPIRNQDAASVVNSVASNVVGRDLAWRWLNENWSEIVATFDTAISSSVGKQAGIYH